MQVIRHIVEDNRSAATIVLEVDRETKGAFLYLSVCRKDNFCRKTGVQIALSRDPILYFKLKALDNFKTRALKAIAAEMFLDEYDRVDFVSGGWNNGQVYILSRFLRNAGTREKAY